LAALVLTLDWEVSELDFGKTLTKQLVPVKPLIGTLISADEGKGPERMANIMPPQR